MGFGLFGLFELVFPILFLAMFCLVFGTILFTLIKSFRRERQNDASPTLTVEATVVSRRTHVHGSHAHTNYYATFQVASGDRMELSIPYDRFGYLIDGDRGRLTFQGTRFLSFDRG